MDKWGMDVGSAEDMARLLRAASAGSAAEFARAEREKACAGWSREGEAFWRTVVELLEDPAALAPTHPAPGRPVRQPGPAALLPGQAR